MRVRVTSGGPTNLPVAQLELERTPPTRQAASSSLAWESKQSAGIPRAYEARER